MIFNKKLRLIWGILFTATLVSVLSFERSALYALIFGITSGLVFSMDFIIISLDYKKSGIVDSRYRRRWHIFSKFTQWLFWTSILYVPFVPGLSTSYKIFVIVDFFIVSTFAFSKFTKTN
jgi:hypothetical protein